MAGLPPKPGDPLPPHLGRVVTSPRAASMRDDTLSRDRDREDRRRRSPQRQDAWRRPLRDEDRYQDQPLRRERDRPRARSTRDRVAMDTYVPYPHSPSRRRSPQHRRRPSSRSRSPPSRERVSRSPRRPPQRSASPYRSSRSRSPYRRRSSPYARRPSPRGRRRHWSDRSLSPRSQSRRHSPNHRLDKYAVNRSPRSRSRLSSEPRDDTHPRSLRHGKSRSRSSKSPLADNRPANSVKENQPPLARNVQAHPPPSGPRRPRTPTGPRARSPISNSHYNIDDALARREGKGKASEIRQEDAYLKDKRRADRSTSPSLGPRKRTKHSRSRSRSQARPLSHSHSRSRSRSRSRFRSRSRSSRSRSHSRSRSRSRSESSSRSMRSRSRVPSHSPSLSRSHRTRSERLSPRVPTGPRAERNTMLHEQNGRKMPNIDDLIPPLKPRQSRTSESDSLLKNIQEQRTKLEKEHINIMRSVRRAQHELDLALMEQRSAEERGKAAQRVHDRAVKGFVEPIT